MSVHHKERMIKDAGIYSIASVMTQFVTVAAAIMTRRFLGPVNMGVWSLLQIIQSYAGYSTLGAQECVYREIPYHQGKGNARKVEELKNLIFSFAMMGTLVISGGLLIYAVFARRFQANEIIYGICIMAVLVLLQRISNLQIAFTRGFKMFGLAARQMFLSAVLNAVLIAFLTYRYQFYGFMIAMTLSLIFNIVYIRMHQSFHFRWLWDTRKIFGLVQYGFPLMAVSFLGVVFLSIDKLMIAKMIGLRELGIYSVAIMAFHYSASLPNSLGVVFIPNFHQKLGESDDLEGLKGYLSRMSGVFTDILPVITAAGWFLIPAMVEFLIPEFRDAIPAVRVLMLGAFFHSMMQPYAYFLTVRRKQMLLVPVVAVACTLAVISNYIVIKNGWGVQGVAAATAAVLFVKYVATYYLSCLHVYTNQEMRKNFSAQILKFTLAVLILIAIRQLPLNPSTLTGAFVLFGFYLLCWSPFLWKLNRDLGVSTMIHKKLKSYSTREVAIGAKT